MIETERLLLRGWREEDVAPMAAINADPKVMAFFPSTQSVERTRQLIDFSRELMARDGYCFFACERRQGGELIGFIGIMTVDFEAAFTPAVEIGWRLAHRHWGQGYATEGARACLDFGFRQQNLDRIVAMAVEANRRSVAVMRRIGMVRVEGGAFDHPRLPPDSPLRRHLLYEARR